jgi:hypothetical protein
MAQQATDLPAPRKWLSLSGVGVAVRYVTAVPFLAAGAALLTIGALIAGTSPPPRKAAGRAPRPNCTLEPRR